MMEVSGIDSREQAADSRQQSADSFGRAQLHKNVSSGRKKRKV
jgi:hypothetical protein